MKFCTGIAQLAEHKTPNLGVGGSSPPARASFILMSPIKGAFFYYNIANAVIFYCYEQIIFNYLY